MDNPYMELDFRPNVQLVSVVRRFVSELYARFLADADTTSRVALATHELLENAVKYSCRIRSCTGRSAASTRCGASRWS